jgi:DNA-binding transcriptional ArsR family regulator
MPTTSTQTSAEAVLAALKNGPASAAEIAEAAGLGRSTATKALAVLADEGRVARRAGGRDGSRRLPDRWSLPASGKGAGPLSRQPGPDSGAAHLGKGELAEMVLAHLRVHPGEHSPTAVAKALGGRSSGAVGNALDRLVAAGDAVRTSPAPRRYQAARRR